MKLDQGGNYHRTVHRSEFQLSIEPGDLRWEPIGVRVVFGFPYQEPIPTFQTNRNICVETEVSCIYSGGQTLAC